MVELHTTLDNATLYSFFSNGNIVEPKWLYRCTQNTNGSLLFIYFFFKLEHPEASLRGGSDGVII